MIKRVAQKEDKGTFGSLLRELYSKLSAVMAQDHFMRCRHQVHPSMHQGRMTAKQSETQFLYM